MKNLSVLLSRHLGNYVYAIEANSQLQHSARQNLPSKLVLPTPRLANPILAMQAKSDIETYLMWLKHLGHLHWEAL
jgi:hypothetical protein